MIQNNTLVHTSLIVHLSDILMLIIMIVIPILLLILHETLVPPLSFDPSPIPFLFPILIIQDHWP